MSFTRWYLKKYDDPHRGLKVLSQAARLSNGVVMLKAPMPIPWTVTGPPWLKSVVALFWKLMAHFFLSLRIRRTQARTVVVREFLTVPLLVCAPLLLTSRKRVWFMVQHNLNNTLTRPLEKLALRLLSRGGFRFVLFEDASTWAMAGIGGGTAAQIRELLHPVPDASTWVGDRSDRATLPVTIGFIGNYRREKSPDWALRAIDDALNSDASVLAGCQLLIGSPDADFRARWAGKAQVRDTSDYADFTQALRDCDVVVLPYTKDSYFFRASGVVAEAVACGSTVVVPDFPWLRHQVQFPAQVGYCYSSPANLMSQLIAAVAASRADTSGPARRAYLQSRGVDALTACLNRWARDGI